MSTADPARQAREQRIRAARAAARRAALDLAVRDGATVVSRPAFRGADSVVRDVEPLAGLRAIREIELGARYHARDYIRDAREAGHSWRQIGAAMGLVPVGEPDLAGETAAEAAAYTYAAGRADSEMALRYGRSFGWRCASCEGLVSDRGPFAGPAEAEPGHTDGCKRLAAAEADWEAQWEAGE
jgi:hypothetical protein